MRWKNFRKKVEELQYLPFLHSLILSTGFYPLSFHSQLISKILCLYYIHLIYHLYLGLITLYPAIFNSSSLPTSQTGCTPHRSLYNHSQNLTMHVLRHSFEQVTSMYSIFHFCLLLIIILIQTLSSFTISSSYMFLCAECAC